MRYALIVVTTALLVSPALAADIYTCGFEPGEGFTIGLLDGQQGWLAKPEVAVQNVFVGSDAQSMAIMADGDYDGSFHWAAEQTWPPHESLSGLVTVSQEIYITHLAAADWMIEFRHPADALVANFIGFHYDGGLYCNDLLIGTWSPTTWMNLTLILDYDLQEVTVELDGQPLAVDMAFYNPGAMFDQIIYYSDDYQPAEQANFMVIDDLRVSVPGTAGDPLISVQTTDGLDWVYQNTPGTMANNGHYCDVFVTVDFLNGNDWVSCSLEKVPVSGEGGEVTFGTTGAGGINWRVYGSMRTDGTTGCGPLTLRVKGWGNIAGQAVVDFPFNVRTCGDIDGNGAAEPGDVSLLVMKLNGIPPAGYHDNAFDLDANGAAEPGDVQILINILNGLPIP